MLLPNQRQGMYIAVTQDLRHRFIDSRSCFLPTMPHQRTKERKDAFLIGHPEWSYAVMQTCLVKRLRTNMDQLYIRESLSNIEQLDD